jgi:hypothetical protein
MSDLGLFGMDDVQIHDCGGIGVDTNHKSVDTSYRTKMCRMKDVVELEQRQLDWELKVFDMIPFFWLVSTARGDG